MERFWKKVNKSGRVVRPELGHCWEWTACLYHDGYGSLGVKRGGRNTTARAHRISWELERGPIPTNLQVLHTCDNRRCVNPDHLFLGTHEQNMSDKVAKGRQDRGEFHGRCKLTHSQVDEIRARYAAGDVLYRELAIEYKISKGQVGMIVRKENWK